MIDLERNGEIFTLTMNDGENRWTTTFVRHFAAALDTVEASDGPAALVTTAASEKFFSNGLDLNPHGAAICCVTPAGIGTECSAPYALFS